MTHYKQTEIVLVDFGFTEGTGSKKRPAIVISNDHYHKRQEIIIAAITSNLDRILPGDTKLDHWQQAGLLNPSVVTGIIRTIKNTLVLRSLGALPAADWQKVKTTLSKILWS